MLPPTRVTGHGSSVTITAATTPDILSDGSTWATHRCQTIPVPRVNRSADSEEVE